MRINVARMYCTTCVSKNYTWTDRHTHSHTNTQTHTHSSLSHIYVEQCLNRSISIFYKVTSKHLVERMVSKCSLCSGTTNWSSVLFGPPSTEGSNPRSLVFCPSLILMALLLFLCEDLFHGLVPVNAPDETCACNLKARRRVFEV